jgi:soluble lytic murein transglycosylase-like protein
MLVWQRIIRGILLVILVAAPAIWYFGYEERSYAALYLTRSDYRPFLLDNWKKQGKGPSVLLINEKVPQSLWDESVNVSRLIALRAQPGDWTEKQIREIALYIVMKSREYDLSPMLVLSLIEVESRYRNWAVSPKGARGLMQLMPETAAGLASEFGVKWRGADDLADPKLNIDLALRYLKALKGMFDTPEHVLTAYNMGPYALQKMLKSGEKPSLGYYKKVMKAMKGYQREARNDAPEKLAKWL